MVWMVIGRYQQPFSEQEKTLFPNQSVKRSNDPIEDNDFIA